MSPHDPNSAERRIHEILRALPNRGAPRALEARVLAELQRHESRPWWRQSYVAWPLSLRGAFLVVTAAVAVALAVGPSRVLNELARRVEWLASLRSLGDCLSGMVQDVLRAIPTPWLWGALAAVAACYAVLAGLGALAYRAFFRSKLQLPHGPSA